MIIGYARVSQSDQSLNLQIDALEKAGCEHIFTDRASGASDNRPGLQEALDSLEEGDLLVICRLDRLGRSLQHLIKLVQWLEERGAGLKTLREEINTTTSIGRFTFHLFGALAQFERELISERTKEGLEAARARGRVGGRTHKLDAEQRARLKAMRESGKYTLSEMCEAMDIGTSTYYRYKNEYEPKEKEAAEEVPLLSSDQLDLFVQ